MTPYLLAALAGIWMADGLALLCFPLLVIRMVQESLQHSPHLLRWQAVGVCLAVTLVACSSQLPYQPLWWIAGGAMGIKSAFLAWGPPTWRISLLNWCFSREAIDYRFIGLGLCALAVLLLHAVGWLTR